MMRLFVGYDAREAVAYHTFCQSVLARATAPVSFTPVTGEQRDGTNSFTYGRFLVPAMCGFEGRALFFDGDMTCLADMAELWNCGALEGGKAVAVVKHDYKTKFPIKYWDQRNEDYPRKNWSSVMMFDCGHRLHRKLTPEFVAAHDGAFLHRFGWLPDDAIGELPPEWNVLAQEQSDDGNAKVVHHTIGLPIDHEYGRNDPWRSEWYSEFYDSQRYGT